MCWIAIFAVTGCSLLIAGGVYAHASFDDPRAVSVTTYNGIVDMWSMKFRKEFEESSFSWRLITPQRQEVTIPGTTCPPDSVEVDCTPTETTTKEMMVAVNVTEEEKQKINWVDMDDGVGDDHLARDQKVDDIHTYSTLEYHAGDIFPSEPDGEWDDTTWTGPEYLLEVRAEMPGKEPSTFTIGPLPLMKQTIIGANQKMCRIHYGNNMHHGHCWDTFALSHICIELNQTANGWSANEYGGIGCGGMQEVVYGKHCPYSKGLLTARSPACDFSPVNITLRSSNDPHAKAMEMTLGTLNFGPTPSENWQQGIIMLSVGALLLLPVMATGYYKYYKNRKVYRDDMARDFDSIRTGSSRSRSMSPPTRFAVESDDDVVYAQPAAYGGPGGTYARDIPNARVVGTSRQEAHEEGTFVRDLPGGRKYIGDENL